MKREWCQEQYELCISVTSQEHRPKQRRLRCPKCKKRFMTTWMTCGDYWCWHEYLPPHKKIVKKSETSPAKQGL